MPVSSPESFARMFMKHLTVAPRKPFRIARPGSVANTLGVPMATLTPETKQAYTNSVGQLTETEMIKIKELFANENSLLKRIVNAVKHRTCNTKPDDLNLKRYSLILKDPAQSDRVKYDLMRQLVALKQIFKGERVVSVNNLSIFDNDPKISAIVLSLLACVGFVTPFAAFGDFWSHIDYGYQYRVQECFMELVREQNPGIPDAELRKKYYKQLDDVRKIAFRESIISTAESRPLSAALSSIFSAANSYGLTQSLITGVIGLFVLPAGTAALMMPVYVVTDTIRQKLTIPMLIKEIEKVIDDPENPAGLRDKVERELRLTTIQPMTAEEVELSLPGSEGPDGPNESNGPNGSNGSNGSRPISFTKFMLTGVNTAKVAPMPMETFLGKTPPSTPPTTAHNEKLRSVYGELDANNSKETNNAPAPVGGRRSMRKTRKTSKKSRKTSKKTRK